MLYRHCYVHRWANKNSHYLHKESPFKAYTFFNFPFPLLIAQAVLIMIHYVEMDRNTSHATDSFL